MAEEKISAHESIREMYERVHGEGLTNVFDRFEAQGKRCTFCSEGIRCALCSNGPCRIKPRYHPLADRGVCGINADGMAMRNMLIRNILGASTYAYHANEVFKTLKATGEGKAPFKIKDEKKLKNLAENLGLDPSLPVNELAVKVAEIMIEDLHRDQTVPSIMVEIFAPEERKETWKKLGIFPGGLLHEIMRATSSCLTNVDSDYVSLALKALRMGISTAYSALLALELAQDVLFGTPTPHETEVDLGVLDPEYVNILPNGHEPFLGALMIEIAHKPEVQQMAKDVGAKGLRVIGSIETGQELLQRYPKDEFFVGMTGNWLNEEMVMATGAVDLLAADMNCSVPALCIYAEKYNSTVIPVSELVSLVGCEKRIDYHPEEAEEQAMELIKIACENFKKRNGKPSHVPQIKKKAIVGFSIESILDALGGSLSPLLEVIKEGKIKGIVALVSCTTLKNSGQDVTTIAVAKELIKRDFLVLGMGCGIGALQVGGLTSLEGQELAGEGLKEVCKALNIPPVLSFGTCTDTGRAAHLVALVSEALNAPVYDLPIAATAPEWMEQKATIDAIFAIAFGLYTHVSPTLPITGAPNLVSLVTEDVEELTGGKVVWEDDPVKAVDGIEAHILEKRKKLFGE